MGKWSDLEENHQEWKAHRELLWIVEDSTNQQMLKSERKDKALFMYVIIHLLYVMNLKSMVSSLEKLYPGLDPNDATMCR